MATRMLPKSIHMIALLIFLTMTVDVLHSLPTGGSGTLCPHQEYCFNGGTCWINEVDGQETYRCACLPQNEGTKCQYHRIVHEERCSGQNYCLNGGSCTVSLLGKTCRCPPEYDGPRCQYRSIGEFEYLFN